METQEQHNELFNLSCEGWHDLLDDTGDDIVYIDLWAQYTEAKEKPFYIMVPFDRLLRYINAEHTELGEYISKVRTNIGGWGPKESKVVAELHESGVEVAELAIEFVYNIYNIWAERQRLKMLAENAKKNPVKARKEHKKLKKHVAEMNRHATNMREETIKEIKLLETLEERINALVLDMYPEITESDPQHIEKWGDRLTRHVRSIAEDVDKISFAARSE